MGLFQPLIFANYHGTTFPKSKCVNFKSFFSSASKRSMFLTWLWGALNSHNVLLRCESLFCQIVLGKQRSRQALEATDVDTLSKPWDELDTVWTWSRLPTELTLKDSQAKEETIPVPPLQTRNDCLSISFSLLTTNFQVFTSSVITTNLLCNLGLIFYYR